MSPGVRRCRGGQICCAQDKRDPVAVPLPWLRAPGGSCGACGRDRRYRPDRPLSISTRRAWTIRLKLPTPSGRRQAAPDGPLAPASAQARGRASARSSFPRYQPLCHTDSSVAFNCTFTRSALMIVGSHAGSFVARGRARMLSRQSGPLPAPAHPSARTPRWTGGRRGTPWPAPL